MILQKPITLYSLALAFQLPSAIETKAGEASVVAALMRVAEEAGEGMEEATAGAETPAEAEDEAEAADIFFASNKRSEILQ